MEDSIDSYVWKIGKCRIFIIAGQYINTFHTNSCFGATIILFTTLFYTFKLSKFMFNDFFVIFSVGSGGHYISSSRNNGFCEGKDLLILLLMINQISLLSVVYAIFGCCPDLVRDCDLISYLTIFYNCFGD